MHARDLVRGARVVADARRGGRRLPLVVGTTCRGGPLPRRRAEEAGGAGAACCSTPRRTDRSRCCSAPRITASPTTICAHCQRLIAIDTSARLRLAQPRPGGAAGLLRAAPRRARWARVPAHGRRRRRRRRCSACIDHLQRALLSHRLSPSAEPRAPHVRAARGCSAAPGSRTTTCASCSASRARSNGRAGRWARPVSRRR